MRRIFVAVIVLCVLYFLAGWVAVQFGWVDKNDYFAYAGIVGGLASVAGLVSLTRPALGPSDVARIEASALRSIADTTEELEKLRAARSMTEQELGSLELKKKEMELLVRRASLALFLKEQHAYHERAVLEEIDRNSRLKTSLEEATEAGKKLAALNEEIDTHPNVMELKAIIETASMRAPTIEEALQSLPSSVRRVYSVFRALEKVAASIVYK
jgi:hypothetical protein